jgi:hypothetical protein
MASFFDNVTPLRSQYSQYSTDSNVAGLMMSHFPREYAKTTILNSPNVSFQDRMRLMHAMDTAAAQGSPERTTVQLSDWLPAAVGAGLGVVGAALTAPIFGLTPAHKKIYGIGAGALGAVLNTYGRD